MTNRKSIRQEKQTVKTNKQQIERMNNKQNDQTKTINEQMTDKIVIDGRQNKNNG